MDPVERSGGSTDAASAASRGQASRGWSVRAQSGEVSMIVVTTETVEGRRIAEAYGLVRGSTVRARSVGRDIIAGLKNVVGGEITEYTNLLSQSRDQALSRMIDEAQAHGADAVVSVRFGTSGVMGGASEILAYGTAVKLA